MPPVCETVWENHLGPFDGLSTSIPVYVPVGCRTAYAAADQWNRFTNIIEIDEFPVSGIEAVEEDSESQSHTNGVFYDLNGRRVITPVRGQIYLRKGKKSVL